jgi:hypothetical protein
LRNKIQAVSYDRIYRIDRICMIGSYPVNIFIMSNCAALEAGLMRSQADSKRLIRAVVGRMLAG